MLDKLLYASILVSAIVQHAGEVCVHLVGCQGDTIIFAIVVRGELIQEALDVLEIADFPSSCQDCGMIDVHYALQGLVAFG